MCDFDVRGKCQDLDGKSKITINSFKVFLNSSHQVFFQDKVTFTYMMNIQYFPINVIHYPIYPIQPKIHHPIFFTPWHPLDLVVVFQSWKPHLKKELQYTVFQKYFLLYIWKLSFKIHIKIILTRKFPRNPPTSFGLGSGLSKLKTPIWKK